MKLTDTDGIDGPFDRAMDRAMREDRGIAEHLKACGCAACREFDAKRFDQMRSVVGHSASDFKVALVTADTITDEQIRELLAYADREAQLTLLSNCRVALSRDIRHSHRAAVGLAREHCAQAYARVFGSPEWEARHLPRGAFETAELIAQFVIEQAAEWEHIEQVHDALVDVARKIRTADWTPEARARCAEILNARRSS